MGWGITWREKTQAKMNYNCFTHTSHTSVVSASPELQMAQRAALVFVPTQSTLHSHSAGAETTRAAVPARLLHCCKGKLHNTTLLDSSTAILMPALSQETKFFVYLSISRKISTCSLTCLCYNYDSIPKAVNSFNQCRNLRRLDRSSWRFHIVKVTKNLLWPADLTCCLTSKQEKIFPWNIFC